MPEIRINSDGPDEAYECLILDTDDASVRIMFKNIQPIEREECFASFYNNINGIEDGFTEMTPASITNAVNAANGSTSLPFYLTPETWENFKEIFAVDTNAPEGREIDEAVMASLEFGTPAINPVVVVNSEPRVFLPSLDVFFQMVPTDREKVLRALATCIEGYESGDKNCPITFEPYETKGVIVISARQPEDSHFANIRQFSGDTAFPDDLSYHVDLLIKSEELENKLTTDPITNFCGYGNTFLKFDLDLNEAAILALKDKYDLKGSSAKRIKPS